jgi:transcriptional repressor NrdR
MASPFDVGVNACSAPSAGARWSAWPMVIKKNGEHQHFDKEKLLHSMKVSCSKRPVTIQQLEQAVADIEWSIVESGQSELTSIEIGQQVMNALKALDEIAYIRFASVYRRFKDVTELMNEMKELVEKPAEKAIEKALDQVL